MLTQFAVTLLPKTTSIVTARTRLSEDADETEQLDRLKKVSLTKIVASDLLTLLPRVLLDTERGSRFVRVRPCEPSEVVFYIETPTRALPSVYGIVVGILKPIAFIAGLAVVSVLAAAAGLGNCVATLAMQMHMAAKSRSMAPFDLSVFGEKYEDAEGPVFDLYFRSADKVEGFLRAPQILLGCTLNRFANIY